MTAIYRREISSYFKSMTGYVFCAIVIAFVGINFLASNLTAGFPYFAYTLSASLVIFIIAVPLLTMRSIAEERRSNTDQMLLTYPVRVRGIVLGKFLAMLTVYAIPLVLFCLCPLILSFYSYYSFSIDYSSIFAFLCLGALFISIGMFISSQTDSQLTSAIASIGVLLLLCLWEALTNLIPNSAVASLVGYLVILCVLLALVFSLSRSRLATIIAAVIGLCAIGVFYVINSASFTSSLKNILGAFSVPAAIGNFTSYYVFDLKSIIFFLTFSAMFVFLTIQSIEKRRWS